MRIKIKYDHAVSALWQEFNGLYGLTIYKKIRQLFGAVVKQHTIIGLLINEAGTTICIEWYRGQQKALLVIFQDLDVPDVGLQYLAWLYGQRMHIQMIVCLRFKCKLLYCFTICHNDVIGELPVYPSNDLFAYLNAPCSFLKQ